MKKEDTTSCIPGPLSWHNITTWYFSFFWTKDCEWYKIRKEEGNFERRDFMFRNGNKRNLSLVLCVAMVFGTLFTGWYRAEAVERPGEGSENRPGAVSGPAASGSAISGPSVSNIVYIYATPTPTPDDPKQTPLQDLALNKKSANLMKGKTLALTVSGTVGNITWTSSDETVATVSETGVVKGMKKGTATIVATSDDRTVNNSVSCKVNVVPKMSKKDFGKFKGENFVSYCQRKGYDGGYAWWHQYKGSSKKKSTYRGIKIGKKKSAVNKAYGDLTWNKCTSKDPFTKMKGLKKNKVKQYGDVKYGKYRIRFYLNKNNKVVAIVLACNIGRIKKKALKRYM